MKATADLQYKANGGKEQAKRALALLNPRFERDSSVSEESSSEDADDMFKPYKIRRQVVNGITMAASEEEIMKQAARQFMIIKRKQMMAQLIMQGKSEFTLNDQKIRNMIKEISVETIYLDLMAMCERFENERINTQKMVAKHSSDMDLMQAEKDLIQKENQRREQTSLVEKSAMTGDELQSRVIMGQLS